MIGAINVFLFAAINERFWNADIWYCIPMIIAVSLVYSATRHEDMGPILYHAVRLGLWISGFMAAFFVILWMLSK